MRFFKKHKSRPDDVGTKESTHTLAETLLAEGLSLGRPVEALKTYDKAIELKQDFAEAWYKKGFTLFKLDRYEKALKALDKATELKQDFADAWYEKSSTLYKLGRYEEALEACEKIRELKPDDEETELFKKLKKMLGNTSKVNE